MRLNKYIASSGICSRRKADELTLAGKVRINGAVMTTPGYDVSDGDTVSVNGRTIRPDARFYYYMLNKPVGYITTMEDTASRPIVTDLMNDVPHRVFPVGRLDYNTSGLLLMTNDGDLSNRLMSPKHGVKKTYIAVVTGMVTLAKAERLEKGVDIGGYVTAPAEIEIIRQGKEQSIIKITISEGKNRQVRKMFAAIGHKVVGLERIAIGDLKMAHLKPGHYRKLSVNEIEYLKRL